MRAPELFFGDGFRVDERFMKTFRCEDSGNILFTSNKEKPFSVFLSLLEERLRLSRRLCVLGAGAASNGDDAAGPLVAGKLRRRLGSRSRALVLDGGTAPKTARERSGASPPTTS